VWLFWACYWSRCFARLRGIRGSTDFTFARATGGRAVFAVFASPDERVRRDQGDAARSRSPGSSRARSKVVALGNRTVVVGAGTALRLIRECPQSSQPGLHDHSRDHDSKGRRRGDDRHDGGRFGGYALYLIRGKPVFVYNLLDLKRVRWEGGVGAQDWLGRSLSPGKHTIAFDFKYDGPGMGKGGTGVLSVDGKTVSNQKAEHTIPFLMSLDESLDIGMDTRTGVDDSYKLPFKFTGTINKVTYNIGPEQLTAADREEMQRAIAAAQDTPMQ
jgi:hypothetical protein